MMRVTVRMVCARMLRYEGQAGGQDDRHIARARVDLGEDVDLAFLLWTSMPIWSMAGLSLLRH